MKTPELLSNHVDIDNGKESDETGFCFIFKIQGVDPYHDVVEEVYQFESNVFRTVSHSKLVEHKKRDNTKKKGSNYSKKRSGRSKNSYSKRQKKCESESERGKCGEDVGWRFRCPVSGRPRTPNTEYFSGLTPRRAAWPGRPRKQRRERSRRRLFRRRKPA